MRTEEQTRWDRIPDPRENRRKTPEMRPVESLEEQDIGQLRPRGWTPRPHARTERWT